MATVIAYFWSRKDGERALAFANSSPDNVTLRKGQRWKGETERCDRVMIFGPLYLVEEAYRAKGVPVEAEDILPDWTPPWVVPVTDHTAGETLVDVAAVPSFASPAAEKAATAAGLDAFDFATAQPSGKRGYTLPDVMALIAKKAG